MEEEIKKLESELNLDESKLLICKAKILDLKGQIKYESSLKNILIGQVEAKKSMLNSLKASIQNSANQA